MDFGLKGKTALVTGGGSGLGKGICEILAQEGANIVVHFRSNEDKVLSFVHDLNEKYDGNSIAVKGDLSREGDLNTVFDTACNSYPEIDILVNNAGVWPKAYVKDMEVDEFENTLKVNLQTPFILCKKMVNHLIDQKRKGKIINIVSQAAFHGSTSGHAHYAASKGGLVTFTVSLAREVAKHGINVNAVAPGIMETPMITNRMSEQKIQEAYHERIPLGRISTPEEVAYTVAFLASNKSDYITGATIDVTGGMLMR
ncbi:SDR family NAD(P)-dependent oxidoreductase [Shouchella rhizosphaerae]|uniref:SDR family NAD(P)-dependent oxidoreductase n=1 Tax=Shouchella rhizosphaerae TaxID=866786 RepID=UPI003F7EC2DE